MLTLAEQLPPILQIPRDVFNITIEGVEVQTFGRMARVCKKWLAWINQSSSYRQAKRNHELKAEFKALENARRLTLVGTKLSTIIDNSLIVANYSLLNKEYNPDPITQNNMQLRRFRPDQTPVYYAAWMLLDKDVRSKFKKTLFPSAPLFIMKYNTSRSKLVLSTEKIPLLINSRALELTLNANNSTPAYVLEWLKFIQSEVNTKIDKKFKKHLQSETVAPG